eukprot:200413-Alexandrium_andersonii.AAC.1
MQLLGSSWASVRHASTSAPSCTFVIYVCLPATHQRTGRGQKLLESQAVDGMHSCSGSGVAGQRLQVAWWQGWHARLRAVLCARSHLGSS